MFLLLKLNQTCAEKGRANAVPGDGGQLDQVPVCLGLLGLPLRRREQILYRNLFLYGSVYPCLGILGLPPRATQESEPSLPVCRGLLGLPA